MELAKYSLQMWVIVTVKSVPICVGPEFSYVSLQPSSMKDGADSEQEELPQTQEVKITHLPSHKEKQLCLGSRMHACVFSAQI